MDAVYGEPVSRDKEETRALFEIEKMKAFARQREAIEIDAHQEGDDEASNECVMAITTAQPSRSQSQNGSSHDQEGKAKQTEEGGDVNTKSLFIGNASNQAGIANLNLTAASVTAAVAPRPDVLPNTVIRDAVHSKKDDRTSAVPHPAYETAYTALKGDRAFVSEGYKGSSDSLEEGKAAMRVKSSNSHDEYSNENEPRGASTATYSGNDRHYPRMHTDDNSTYRRSSPLRPANRSYEAAGPPHSFSEANSYDSNGAGSAAAIAASKELRAYLGGVGGGRGHSENPLYHNKNARDRRLLVGDDQIPMEEDIHAFESYDGKGQRKGGGKGGEYPMPRRGHHGADPDYYYYFRSSYPYAFDGEEETMDGSRLHSSPLPQHNYLYHVSRPSDRQLPIIGQSGEPLFAATDFIEDKVAQLLAKEREQRASLSATRSRLGRLRRMIHEATAADLPAGSGIPLPLKSEVPPYRGVHVGGDSMGHYDTSWGGREDWHGRTASALHKSHPARKSPETTSPALNASGPHVVNINVAAPTTHPITTGSSSSSSLFAPPPPPHPRVHHLWPAYDDVNSSVYHRQYHDTLPFHPHPYSSTSNYHLGGGGGLRQHQQQQQYQPSLVGAERTDYPQQQQQQAMYFNSDHYPSSREQPRDVGAEARAFILDRQRMGLSVLARPNNSSASTAATFISDAAAAANSSRIGAKQRPASAASSPSSFSTNRVTSEARLPKGFVGVSTTPMGTVRHIASRIAAAREAMSLDQPMLSPSTNSSNGGGLMLSSGSSASSSPNLMRFTASPTGYPSATIEILPTDGTPNGEWEGREAGGGSGGGRRPPPLPHNELTTAPSPLFMRQTRATNRSIGPFDTDALVEEVKAIARAREAREAQRRHQNAYSPASQLSSMF